MGEESSLVYFTPLECGYISSIQEKTKTDEGLTSPAIFALVTVLRGIVSFRGPSCRTGLVFMQHIQFALNLCELCYSK